jgi:hypothetical protein
MMNRLRELNGLLAARLHDTRLHWLPGARFTIAFGAPPDPRSRWPGAG